MIEKACRRQEEKLTVTRYRRRGRRRAAGPGQGSKDVLEEEPQAEEAEEDEEDYVAFVIGRLQTARQATREADAALQRAQDEERAVWAGFEGYLLEAARWHQQQTGSRRLESDRGRSRCRRFPSGRWWRIRSPWTPGCTSTRQLCRV